MQTIGESARHWAGAQRPLKALTKAQLFKYPKAMPELEAYWDFSKELIARGAAMLDLQGRGATADRDVNGARMRLHALEVNLIRAQEKLAATQEMGVDGAIEQDIVRTTQNAVDSAKRVLAQLATKADEIKASVQESSGLDNVISQTEIEKYYSEKYAAEWNEVLRQWRDLELFGAQRHGWRSFLGVKRAERIEDDKKYFKVRGLAILMNQEKGATFQSINALWQTRIMPTLSARREFLIDGDPEAGTNVASLKPEAKQRFHQWYRRYNKMTVGWQWMDDSGVAYDPRQFNPNDEAETELDQ